MYYKQNKFKLNYFTKYFFNYFYLLNVGLHLGGLYKSKHMSNCSIIYGLKKKHSILALTKLVYELKKISKIIEIISLKRGVIYFVNSHISFQIIFKNIFNEFNKHFLKKKKKLLEYIYVFSKWYPGFLSNNKSYSNSLNNYIKFPRLPHFGFLMDYSINLVCLKEFKKKYIPYSSLTDILNFTINNNFYTLIGNGKSLDSTYFFLFNCINSFFVGYFNEKLKFGLIWRSFDFISINSIWKNFFFLKIFSNWIYAYKIEASSY